MPFEAIRPEWILVAMCILGLILFVPYGLGPVLIYFTHRQAAQPTLVPFKPGITPLPDEVDKFFHSTSWALANEGFEILTGVFLPTQVENVIASLIVLINKQDATSAVAVAMHANAVGMMKSAYHVEFVTRFKSGLTIQTNNAQPLNAFPTPPDVINSFLPSVYDPVQLYRIHQEMVRRRGTGARAWRLDDEFGGDVLMYMTVAIIEELEAACKAGLMRLDIPAAQYRPTVPGAFQMTYGELWPFKWLRMRRRAQQERALLSELQMAVAMARP
jgi:hypothetical protein